MNSPFFPPHIGAEPGRPKEESRITCMLMLRTPPFLPPSGEKPYLVVFTRFGLWRDFLNDNIQATISVFRLIKNMSISQISGISPVPHKTTFDLFFITISKITNEISAKICWQLKTPTRTWKCTRCIMQMCYLHASDFPFKNFCKIAQHTETIRKQCLAKE